MKRNKLIILFVLILQSILLSQRIPSYLERTLFENRDSILISSLFSEHSEGPIDIHNYIVGPGDVLLISISGIDEKNFSIKINPDGFIYIPQIGVIDLRGKTLFQSIEKIKERLLKSFKNVEIYITIQNFRKIKVSLIGNVLKPSNYILSSTSKLFDLFTVSKGITSSSDLRNIKVISRDGNEKKYDLLRFLRLADFSQNPRLNDGDIIIVDKAERFISLFGHIKYSGNYEYKPDESIDEILELAGGLMFKAFKDSIEIVRFTKDGKTQYSLFYSYDYIKNNNIKVEPNDLIIVREVPDYYDLQYVTISGLVRYPGVYKIVKDKTTLKEIITQAGGFLDNASLLNSTLLRVDSDTVADSEYERLKFIPRSEMSDDEYDYFKAKSRQKVGKVVVNFEKLFLHNKQEEDILLKSGDIIIIPEKKAYVTIIGQVVNPGNIPYKSHFKVEDYINYSGGFGWRAVEDDVRVIRATSGEWIDADDVKDIYPGDIIWVPEKTPPPKFWEVFTTSLQVVGQIASIVAATVAVIIATR